MGVGEPRATDPFGVVGMSARITAVGQKLPTAGMGCDSRYIPLFHTNDGMIDLVYTSYPRITILSGP